MTCRNLFYQKHADMEHEAAVKLFRQSCPDDFGYAEEPEYCIGTNVEGDCTRCWERQAEEKLTYEHTDIYEKGCEVKMEPVIKDSGNRREFSSGAVRDMQEGKGRCDLMPLEVVAEMIEDDGRRGRDPILFDISCFLDKNDEQGTAWLKAALENFAHKAYNGCYPTMFLEVAKHFEAGAKKYGESNWQKGIPPKCYIDSAVRHYLKWRRGDKDEPHDRAFVWNLVCCIWEVDYHEKENE